MITYYKSVLLHCIMLCTQNLSGNDIPCDTGITEPPNGLNVEVLSRFNDGFNRWLWDPKFEFRDVWISPGLIDEKSVNFHFKYRILQFRDIGLLELSESFAIFREIVLHMWQKPSSLNNSLSAVMYRERNFWPSDAFRCQPYHNPQISSVLFFKSKSSYFCVLRFSY